MYTKNKFVPVQKNCVICNELFIVDKPCLLKKRKCCSRKCSALLLYQIRIKENPEFFENTVAKMNTPEANKSKGRKGATHHSWLPRVAKTCKECGNTFYVKRDVHAKGKGKFCSQSCAGVYRIRNRGFPFCDTKIELKLQSILDSHGILYEKQKSICGCLSDLFVPPRFVIFADGDYWHSLPNMIARDKIVNEKLEGMGYKVIRFPEYLINSNPLLVEQNILKEINAKEKGSST